jgi:hypothetical protein
VGLRRQRGMETSRAIPSRKIRGLKMYSIEEPITNAGLHGTTPWWINDQRSSSDRKKMVCFGDSFVMANNAIVNGAHLQNQGIQECNMHNHQESYDEINAEWHRMHHGHTLAFDSNHPDFEEYTGNWMTRLAMLVDYDFVSYGMSGTGTFYSYYSMLNHLARAQSAPEVIIFVLSPTHRIWSDSVVNLCPGTIINAQQEIENGTWKKSQRASRVIESARLYYADLFDHDHERDKLTEFCYYFDNHITQLYPDTKFIILHGFNEFSEDESKNDPHEFQYVYEFKNCTEIRPPLIYLSGLDDPPEDFSMDNRQNHFTTRVQKALAAFLAGILSDTDPLRYPMQFLNITSENLPEL